MKLYCCATFLLLFSFPTFAQTLYYHKDSLRGLAFSMETLDRNLFSSLQDSSVGWAYSICKDGTPVFERSGGYKITPADCKDSVGIPFTIKSRLHIASLSKTITAVAIAKLVEMKKISWDAKVKSFLPSRWSVHPLFEQLTIRELLTMKSGLDGPLDQLSSGFDSLEVLIKRGPNPAKMGVFHYQNTAYGLLRIIVAYASGFKEYASATANAALSVATANSYKKFVIKHVFAAAGVDSAECRILDSDPAFNYPFPYHGEPGELSGAADLTEFAGGFGWYISTADAAKVLRALFHQERILSLSTLKELADAGYPFSIRKGKFGTYTGNGGDWGHPTDSGSWRGIHTFFYCFPDNVLVTVFTNSGDKSPSFKMMRAYNNAFK